MITKIRQIIIKHTKKLDALKANQSKADELGWTDADVNECEQQIRLLADILSDLNKACANKFTRSQRLMLEFVKRNGGWQTIVHRVKRTAKNLQAMGLIEMIEYPHNGKYTPTPQIRLVTK